MTPWGPDVTVHEAQWPDSISPPRALHLEPGHALGLVVGLQAAACLSSSPAVSPAAGGGEGKTADTLIKVPQGNLRLCGGCYRNAGTRGSGSTPDGADGSGLGVGFGAGSSSSSRWTG